MEILKHEQRLFMKFLWKKVPLRIIITCIFKILPQKNTYFFIFSIWGKSWYWVLFCWKRRIAQLQWHIGVWCSCYDRKKVLFWCSSCFAGVRWQYVVVTYRLGARHGWSSSLLLERSSLARKSFRIQLWNCVCSEVERATYLNIFGGIQVILVFLKFWDRADCRSCYSLNGALYINKNIAPNLCSLMTCSLPYLKMYPSAVLAETPVMCDFLWTVGST